MQVMGQLHTLVILFLVDIYDSGADYRASLVVVRKASTGIELQISCHLAQSLLPIQTSYLVYDYRLI
jgi:hypothetical protein